MKKAIKEFIIEEHANACSEWKKKIEEKYPELFKPKTEVGKWYKNGNGKTLFVQLENDTRKGFGSSGSWQEVIGKAFDSTLTPATDKEVETALIAEAKRRGFKEGVKLHHTGINNFLDDSSWEPIRGEFKYFPMSNVLDDKSENGFIFENGKWASIIEEEKPEETPFKISNETNNWTISKKELKGISFTVENKNEEPQTITILGCENPLTINVPENTTITINT